MTFQNNQKFNINAAISLVTDISEKKNFKWIF